MSTLAEDVAMMFAAGAGVTLDELEVLTGANRQTLRRHIRQLRAAKSIYVSAWSRTGKPGRDTAEFKWGNKPDATPPAALTPAQRLIAHRLRKKL